MVSKLLAKVFKQSFVYNGYEVNIFLGLLSFSFVIFVAYNVLFNNIFNLNTLTSNKFEWQFTTNYSSSFHYDENLISLSDKGVSPKEFVNLLKNPNFDNNNNNWSVGAVPPSGWIEVPGNPELGTSNFLVMKYEAKCANISTPTVGLTTPAEDVHVYTDTDIRNASSNCTKENGRKVVSIPSGYTIGQISHTYAKIRCLSVLVNGRPSHLIYNNEWMTIARNAELVRENWSKGAVGSGYLYSGHNNGAPWIVLEASANDENRAAYTDPLGKIETLKVASNLEYGQSGNYGNQVRTHLLSNGASIWDMAGNVNEYVNLTIIEKDFPRFFGSLNPETSQEPTSIINYSTTLSYNDIRSINSTYNRSNGVGSILTTQSNYSNTLVSIIRGQRWDSTSSSGLFNIRTFFTDDNGSRFGFRCANDSVSNKHLLTSNISNSSSDMITIDPISDGKVFQIVNVGDNSKYEFSAEVFDLDLKSEIENSLKNTNTQITSLWYKDVIIPTKYTDLSSIKDVGWWKLTGSIIGANENREVGVFINAGKTIQIDNLILNKETISYIYTKTSLLNSKVINYDMFCEGEIVNSKCITDSITDLNTSIKYQVCLDDGDICESQSLWQYWNGKEWSISKNNFESNKASELDRISLHALQTNSKKISFKVFLDFNKYSVPLSYPTLKHLSLSYI